MAKQVQEWALGLEKYRVFRNLDIESYVKQLDFSWSDIAKNTLNGIANSLGSIFNFVAATTVIIGTVPFVLFYMLKDGEKLVPMLAKAVPVRQRANFIDLLGEMNKTIATYISGQAIECLFVFVMMFFGYLILGIKYAFLFAVIAGLCNLIPYIGPYLGLAPSFLATVFVDPFKALIIIVIVLVVQQIDGNLIYPNVIGKTLSIHPLAIIFVLLVAGNIAGLLGIFLGVPFYAICKTIIKFIWSLYCANKANLEQEKIEEETTQSEEI
jgi:predicted PurR-regulated permease PerM